MTKYAAKPNLGYLRPPTPKSATALLVVTFFVVTILTGIVFGMVR